MAISYLTDSDHNRRAFLGRAAGGLGAAALSSLLSNEATATPKAGKVKAPHFPAKAKTVIFLYMAGGPSQLETFDAKPKLAQWHGKPMPDSIVKGEELVGLLGKKLIAFAPQYPFKKYGKSGQEMTTLFPKLGEVADEIAIVRSMQTDAINHGPAHTLMNTGTKLAGRPSMGSWAIYGLGNEAKNLPGFVVMVSDQGVQPLPATNWNNGFLPSRYQGVQFRSKGEPVLYVNRPPGVDKEGQREVVEAVAALTRMRKDLIDDPQITARVAAYELAFHMQTSVPELMDFRSETRETLDLYGAKPGDGSFGSNCLLARRMAQRGVRFIQIYLRGWDHHSGIKAGIAGMARAADQASAALIKDLRRRGMLDETLVVWGGEFGRTPMNEKVQGRDHHMKAFSMWMAGGGIRPGITYSSTDEFGFNVIEDVMHVNDLHATILHLLGIDHKRLTFRFQGRDFRLTDVAGKVAKGLLT